MKTTKSTSEAAIEDLYKLGDRQTDKAYIQAVLEIANSLTDFDEVLTLSKRQPSSPMCVYRGKSTSLAIKAVSWSDDKGYTATLRLGKINYKATATSANPTSHKGNALDLTTHLLDLDDKTIRAARNRRSNLSFELDIQIPLGDYGTDGFTETAEVGKAWVEYLVKD